MNEHTPQTMNGFDDHDERQPLPLEEESSGAVVEWLARDSRDHVALFTVVASAEFPPPVLDELDAHRRALAAILEAPVTTRSVFGPPVGNERGNRWRSLVDRGLFVFAAYRSGGPYWIAEAPHQPQRTAELPSIAVALLARLPRLGLPFKHVASVMPEDLGIDLSGATRSRRE